MNKQNAEIEEIIRMLKEESSYQQRIIPPLNKLVFTKALIEELNRDCRYLVNPQNKEVLMALIDYFCMRQTFLNNQVIEFGKPSLDKGIYLYGQPGSGKTDIMDAIGRVIRRTQFSKKYPRDLRFIRYQWGNIFIDANNHGLTTIKIYGNSLANGIDRKRPMNYWFDEFEPNGGLKNYGTTIDLNDIFKFRYDLFRKKKIVTHITSNVCPSELPGILPKKIMSRFYEMFNFIPLGAEDNYTDFRLVS